MNGVSYTENNTFEQTTTKIIKICKIINHQMEENLQLLTFQ